MPSYADLLLLLALAAPFPPTQPAFETVRIERSGDLVDLEIDSRGALYLLFSGRPHLAVMPTGGGASWFDLDPVILPGGLCLDGIWGGFVTDAATGTVWRFDASWMPVDSLSAPGRPGDVSLVGLSVLFVSRAMGAVLTADGDGMPLLRLEGSGEGTLTASSAGAVYSDGAESYLLTPAEAPVRLPPGARWAAAGTSTVSLSGDTLLLPGGPVAVTGAPPGARLSCSPDGRAIAVWIPGGGEVLVSR